MPDTRAIGARFNSPRTLYHGIAVLSSLFDAQSLRIEQLSPPTLTERPPLLAVQSNLMSPRRIMIRSSGFRLFTAFEALSCMFRETPRSIYARPSLHEVYIAGSSVVVDAGYFFTAVVYATEDASSSLVKACHEDHCWSPFPVLSNIRTSCELSLIEGLAPESNSLCFHSLSRGLRFLYASRARSSAALAPYRESIVRDRQPPSRIRSPSWPPRASH